jgi:hypothetical protein
MFTDNLKLEQQFCVKSTGIIFIDSKEWVERKMQETTLVYLPGIDPAFIPLYFQANGFLLMNLLCNSF